MVPLRVLRLLSVKTSAGAGSSQGEPKKDVSWNIMSRGVTLFVPLRCVGVSSVWGASMNAIEQTRWVAGVGTARRRCISRGKQSVE